jgi:putative tryptophan/tyrosine transport system substrate-binding protein
MNRRHLIKLAGGAAIAWPFAAQGQRSDIPVIGFLGSRSHQADKDLVNSFLQGLKEAGYVDGQNVSIEYRWGESKDDRLPGLARELVDRPVTVIAAMGSAAPSLAAQKQTSTIPIVFITGGDPVKLGLVKSFNQPGGNITGVSFLSHSLGPKRLSLILELIPKDSVVGFLFNPNNPNAVKDSTEFPEAAAKLGQKVALFTARNEQELDAAFASMAEQKIGGAVVNSDSMYLGRRQYVVATANKHRIPAMYDGRDFVAVGGLSGYGASRADIFRRAGLHVASIIKGAKPAELPVVQPTKFELIINRKTANALGVTIPSSLLSYVDEVIE